MSNQERKNIRPLIITIAILGIGAIIFDIASLGINIGLTLIAVAGLLAAGEFILDRLRRIGVEKLAFGSLLVTIGFVLLALPVIGFAWDLFTDVTGIYLTVSGIILMILGYTTEYYDLNMKIIEFFENVMGQLSEFIYLFKRKFLRSVWTIFSIILLIYLAISYAFPVILSPLSIIPIVSERLFVVFMVVLFLGIEFHALIWFIILKSMELFSILLLGILRRLRNLPDMLKILTEKLSTLTIFLMRNSFILGILASIVFGLIALSTGDDTLGAFSILILLISLTIIFVSKEEEIRYRLRTNQQKAYRSSFRIRKLFAKNSLKQCPYCMTDIRQQTDICLNCQRQLPKCMVCKNTLVSNEEYTKCSNCKHYYHPDHIRKWVEILPKCPVCRFNWNPE